MSMQPDAYYQILEIEPGASQADIKQAYRDLAKVWHPDRFSDDPRLQQKAEEKLKKINAAYQFLKSYKPQPLAQRSGQKQPVEVLLNCHKLKRLLQLGQLKDADYETTRLLLELAGREKEGWLTPDNIRAIASQALLLIDQQWAQSSNGCFGFGAQSQMWQSLGCKSSNEVTLQTLNEVKFGRAVHWHVNGNWLSRWDAFDYQTQAVTGSLPREYIFALSGWQSYSKGWSGYLLWRFNEIFLKL